MIPDYFDPVRSPTEEALQRTTALPEDYSRPPSIDDYCEPLAEVMCRNGETATAPDVQAAIARRKQTPPAWFRTALRAVPMAATRGIALTGSTLRQRQLQNPIVAQQATYDPSTDSFIYRDGRRVSTVQMMNDAGLPPPIHPVGTSINAGPARVFPGYTGFARLLRRVGPHGDVETRIVTSPLEEENAKHDGWRDPNG